MFFEKIVLGLTERVAGRSVILKIYGKIVSILTICGAHPTDNLRLLYKNVIKLK